MENEGPRCDKCKWWRSVAEWAGSPDPEDEKVGLCCRYAPRPFLACEELASLYEVKKTNPGFNVNEGDSVHWPETNGYDFCGEFTPRKGCPGGPNEKERDSRLLEELLWVYSRSQSGIERGFATRARTVCRRASIVTVDDLAGMRSEDWDFARNHGPVLHNWLTRWAMKHCGVKVSPILR